LKTCATGYNVEVDEGSVVLSTVKENPVEVYVIKGTSWAVVTRFGQVGVIVIGFE